jgi:hypothetical protein
MSAIPVTFERDWWRRVSQVAVFAGAELHDRLRVSETEHAEVLFAMCWPIDLCETDWAVDLTKESE